ncbi:MAG TPA: MORN motif precursor, partial [Sneathiellales bacterium]|nr:MORN motif precursor [Sneathiellales bacterium]
MRDGAEAFKAVGAWVRGKKNGEGMMTYANGDVYVGAWADGERNGEGTLTFA